MNYTRCLIVSSYGKSQVNKFVTLYFPNPNCKSYPEDDQVIPRNDRFFRNTISRQKGDFHFFSIYVIFSYNNLLIQ